MDQQALSLNLFKRKIIHINREFHLQEKGQILLEGLFFIIFILSFLLAVQFFQQIARKEIQKERLSKQKSYKIRKAPWVKNKEGI